MSESASCEERCRELEANRDRMRIEIVTLQQALARLETERDSLLASQINLLKDLARDLLRHGGVAPAVAANGTPVGRIVLRLRRLFGGLRSAGRKETMLVQTQHTVEELHRLAQALVINSSQ